MSSQPGMTLENKILLHLSQIDLDETDIVQIKELASPKIDWTFIARKAIENFVFPQVYQNLRKMSTMFNGESRLDDLLERMRPAWHGMLSGNLVLYSELKRILKGLKSQGVLFMPIKGVALGETVYPSRDLRYLSDIDLLFKNREEMKEAEKILVMLGYYYDPKSVYVAFGSNYIRKGIHSTKCDLHYFLPGWSDYYSYPTIENLWDTALIADIEGVKTYMMTPENMFLILALHSFREGTFTLKDYCDAMAILKKVPKFDWDVIWHYSSQEGWRYILPAFLYILGCVDLSLRNHSSIIFPKWIKSLSLEEGDNEFPISYSLFCRKCSPCNYCPIFFRKILRKKSLQLKGTLKNKPLRGPVATINIISSYFWETILLFRFLRPRARIRDILNAYLTLTRGKTEAILA